MKQKVVQFAAKQMYGKYQYTPVLKPLPQQSVYPMTLQGGHVIIEIGAHTALIDTGSPVSFASGQVSFYWSPKETAYKWQAPKKPWQQPASIAKINKLAGLNIDMLIGNDILGSCNFVLDFSEGQLVLVDSKQTAKWAIDAFGTIPMTWDKLVPKITGTLDAKTVPLIVDTGAYQTFQLPKPWPFGGQKLGKKYDFTLAGGVFMATLYAAHVGLGDPESFSYVQPHGSDHAVTAALPWSMYLPMVTAFKAKGIIGTDILGSYDWVIFTKTQLILGPQSGILQPTAPSQ